MNSRIRRCVLVSVLAVASAACLRGRSVDQGADLVPEPENLAAVVAGVTPGDWHIYDQVKQFSPENLYEQINGRAELYLSYDIVKMTYATFENPADPRQFIELCIYDMGTPTNAFGVFSVERSRDAPSVEFGRAGYRSGASVYVWDGHYYVTVIGSADTDHLREMTIELARNVTNSLMDSDEPVWGLTALPEEDRIGASLRYFQVDAMGLDFLRNTYTAQYRKSGVDVAAFLSRQDTLESAHAALDRYAEHAAHYGVGVEETTVAESWGRYRLLTCDLGGAFDVVFQRGRLVGGVTSVADRDLAITVAMDLCERTRHE